MRGRRRPYLLGVCGRTSGALPRGYFLVAASATATGIQDDEDDAGDDREHDQRQHQPASATPGSKSVSLCLLFLIRHGITSFRALASARGSLPVSRGNNS